MFLLGQGLEVSARSQPLRSPSMQDYPRCDDEVQKLAAELWAGAITAEAGERFFGKSRIVWGR